MKFKTSYYNKLKVLRRECKYILKTLLVFVPRFGQRNNKIDWEWNDTLKGLLSNIKEIEADRFNLTINGFRIWISNWPYNYGNCWSHSKDALPSRVTAIKLREVEMNYRKYGPEYYFNKLRMNRNGANKN